jgi:hypothetical protein
MPHRGSLELLDSNDSPASAPQIAKAYCEGTHTCNLSTCEVGEAEAGGSQVEGQLGLYNMTPSQQQQQLKKQEGRKGGEREREREFSS